MTDPSPDQPVPVTAESIEQESLQRAEREARLRTKLKELDAERAKMRPWQRDVVSLVEKVLRGEHAPPDRAEKAGDVGRERANWEEDPRVRFRRNSGVPPAYAQATIIDVPQYLPEDYLHLAGWLSDLTARPRQLVITGAEPRTGKTYLGCGAVLHFCDERRPARYSTLRDYAAVVIGEMWHAKESATREQFRRARLVVIDRTNDRTDDRDGARALAELVDLVVYRADRNLASVLISDRPGNAVWQDLGGVIESRVTARGLMPVRWKSVVPLLEAAARERGEPATPLEVPR